MDKSELIASLMESLGERFSEVRTEAEHDRFRHQGAAKQLLLMAANVAELQKLVDSDLEKGRFDDAAQAQRCKDYLLRAVQMLVDRAKYEGRNEVIAEGRMQGVLDLVRIAEKRKEDARAKKAAQDAAEASGDTEPTEGMHPGPSLKQQRLAEQAAEDAKTMMTGGVKKIGKAKKAKSKKLTRTAVPKKARNGTDS